ARRPHPFAWRSRSAPVLAANAHQKRWLAPNRVAPARRREVAGEPLGRPGPRVARAKAGTPCPWHAWRPRSRATFTPDPVVMTSQVPEPARAGGVFVLSHEGDTHAGRCVTVWSETVVHLRATLNGRVASGGMRAPFLDGIASLEGLTATL